MARFLVLRAKAMDGVGSHAEKAATAPLSIASGICDGSSGTNCTSFSLRCAALSPRISTRCEDDPAEYPILCPFSSSSRAWSRATTDEKLRLPSPAMAMGNLTLMFTVGISPRKAMPKPSAEAALTMSLPLLKLNTCRPRLICLSSLRSTLSRCMAELMKASG